MFSFIFFITVNIYLSYACASNIPSGSLISSVVFYRNRFFICFPNQDQSLYEAPWVGSTLTPPKLKPFPKQDNPCQSLDIDIRGRLWVLSASKLIIYNVIYFTEIQSCELDEGNYGNIVVDPITTPMIGVRAYIGSPDYGEILVYSLKERRYWRLKLQFNGLIIDTAFLTIAKKEGKMFVTGRKSDQMYLVHLEKVRKMLGPPAIVSRTEPSNITVTHLGRTLGPSTGLFADNKGSVYYYLHRDYAVVKWDTKKPLQAENHLILMQSADKIPLISNFFAEPQLAVWAIINEGNGTEVFGNYQQINLYERIMKIPMIQL